MSGASDLTGGRKNGSNEDGGGVYRQQMDLDIGLNIRLIISLQVRM
jgi:hypothetical protein